MPSASVPPWAAPPPAPADRPSFARRLEQIGRETAPIRLSQEAGAAMVEAAADIEAAFLPPRSREAD